MQLFDLLFLLRISFLLWFLDNVVVIVNLKDLTTESHWYTRIFLVDSIHRIVGREIKTLNVGGKEKKPLKRQINYLFSCMTLEGKTDGVPHRSVVTF